MNEGINETKARPEETPEPWLSGSLAEVPAVPRAVLHALELARMDLEKWCGGMTDEEMNARPGGVAPVAFHLLHIARSLDRLLTYAEGRTLSEAQMKGLKTELEAGAKAEDVLAELRRGLAESSQRVKAIGAGTLEEPRFVGRKKMPTTVGGLLVHCADHTQRHVGQAVTTAKIVKGSR